MREEPQTSACFIMPVHDSMESIGEWYSTAMDVYKGGSGLGVNASYLRGSEEPLSIGGRSSGPISFIKSADAIAGSIKSGGASRRAASITTLDIDHPNVEDFIGMKWHEEEKARALLEAGYSGGIEGEAYATVAFQNMNVSVRTTDEFMQAAEDNAQFALKPRLASGEPRYVNARDLLMSVADNAHKCGDPALQFHDTTNHWNTCPTLGEIRASNPCQPGYATVLTPEGIRTFDDIDVGSTIWSGKQWTRVVKKWSTGVKDVYRYSTSFGEFIGTENHRVVCNGEKVPVCDADCIDVATGSVALRDFEFDLQTVMDGYVLGDGSVHKASNNAVYACVGKDDEDVLDELKDHFVKERPAFGTGYDVKTHIKASELPHTYERVIPQRYFQGDRKTVCSFLRGLYAANGSVVANERITLKAASFTVIRQVQKMLSSLGVRSYYTTNKSKKVEFGNGVYTCKESYDLNITRDRAVFMDLVGFIHKYKEQKLLYKKPSHKETQYLVRGSEKIDTCEVFDLTVDCDAHTYWTGGCLVSNCGEFIFDVYEGYGACNLASLNLCQVKHDDFPTVVHTMVFAMDILIDRSGWPHPKFGEAARALRPLGLGYSNLAAYLMRNHLPYDSDEGREVASNITKHLTACAYFASAELAKRKGVFDGYTENAKRMCEIATAQGVEAHAAEDFVGFRNAQATLLAPTGTISFFMGCDTTSLEPLFAHTTFKEFIGGTVEQILAPIVEETLQSLGYKDLSEVREEHIPIFQTAMDFKVSDDKTIPALSPDAHIEMMAAVQPYLSGAISKTINMPASATVQDVFDVYMKSWKRGLKSVTVYRDGSKNFQPLSTKDYTKEEKSPRASDLALAFTKASDADKKVFIDALVADETLSFGPQRRKLPENRPSVTHSFVIGDFKGTLHVGFYPDTKKVGEIFLCASKSGTTVNGLLDCFAIAFSYALQYGVPLSVLTRKFSYQRFEPDGWTTNPKINHAHSIIDYIARLLEKEYSDAKASERDVTSLLIGDEDVDTGSHTVKDGYGNTDDFDAPPCSRCGALMRRAGACHTCPNCGDTNGCG